MRIDNTEVKKAVIRLLEITNGGTGSSAAAAYTLLSAYDSFCYALPLAGLGLLDLDAMNCALIVILTRHQHHEPHEFIPDGAIVFQRLAKNWPANLKRAA